MKKVLVLLADGFEEIEALVPIDLMRRAGLEVVTAGVESLSVTGSRGVSVTADAEIASTDPSAFDAVVLPGGMPGSTNLAASWEVNERVITMFGENRLVAAICAAPPVVLGKAGILEGRKATCYPGTESYSPESVFVKEPVVSDGNLITAQGPGKAADFAFEIIRYLLGAETADRVAAAALF